MKSEVKDIIIKINSLKEELDNYKPISKEIEGKVFQKFRLDWNYNSNAIEGNSLDFGETVAFLKHGLTAKGKPLKDYLDIKGHNEAIDFLLSLVKDNRPLTETDISELHKVILVEPYQSKAVTSDGKPTTKTITIGEYKTQSNSVKTKTGEMHYYATPEETPAKMTDLVVWYNKEKDNIETHPLALASLFHHKFVSIHPFDDGNGRVGRVLMNLILMRCNYPPIIIKNKEKEAYYGALSEADVSSYDSLYEFLGNSLIHSFEIYLKGIKGEDITEKDDIDKEIELFKNSLGKEKTTIIKSKESIELIIKNSIYPLIDELNTKLNNFNELFLKGGFSFIKINNANPIPTFEWLVSEDYLNFPNYLIQMNYFYEWEGFKNSASPFNYAIDINIKFNEYQYEIEYFKNRKQKRIVKKYNEQLIDSEVNKIISEIVKHVIFELNNRH